MLRLGVLYSSCKVGRAESRTRGLSFRDFFITSWVYAGPVLVLILVSLGNRWGLALVFMVCWIQPTSQSSCLQTITSRLNHDIMITHSVMMDMLDAKNRDCHIRLTRDSSSDNCVKEIWGFFSSFWFFECSALPECAWRLCTNHAPCVSDYLQIMSDL